MVDLLPNRFQLFAQRHALRSEILLEPPERLQFLRVVLEVLLKPSRFLLRRLQSSGSLRRLHRRSCEHRAFTERHVLDRFVEVGHGSRFDSVGIPAKESDVQIVLEDLLLGDQGFEFEGEPEDMLSFGLSVDRPSDQGGLLPCGGFKRSHRTFLRKVRDRTALIFLVHLALSI